MKEKVTKSRRQLLQRGAASIAATGVGRSRPVPAEGDLLGEHFRGRRSLDNLLRILAQRARETVSQTVIVDNKTGARSVIGSSFVAKAKPDPYTRSPRLATSPPLLHWARSCLITEEMTSSP